LSGGTKEWFDSPNRVSGDRKGRGRKRNDKTCKFRKKSREKAYSQGEIEEGYQEKKELARFLTNERTGVKESGGE